MSNLVNIRPYRWDRCVETTPGELTVLYFGSPHLGFFDVDRVEVDEHDDRVVVTLFLGNLPNVHGSFTLQAAEQETVVKLGKPLRGRTVVDGAP